MMVSSSVCEPAAPISHTSPHLRPCAGQVPLPLVTAIPQTISRTVDTGVQGGGVRGVGGGGWYQGTRDVTPVVQTRVRTKQVRLYEGISCTPMQWCQVTFRPNVGSHLAVQQCKKVPEILPVCYILTSSITLDFR